MPVKSRQIKEPTDTLAVLVLVNLQNGESPPEIKCDLFFLLQVVKPGSVLLQC